MNIEPSNRIKTFLHNLDSKKVVIGFSWWPDSVATYKLISDYYLSQNWDLNNIYLAHYNHNFRSESHIETDFIQSNYKNVLVWKYEWVCFKEKDLRNARHEFFQDCLKNSWSKTLILWHNLNDRIETTMLNKERWCGLNGLINMREIDNKWDYIIIRPLLGYIKNDIIQYCAERNLHYFIDPTNSDESISKRNKVRKIINYYEDSYLRNVYPIYYKNRENEFDKLSSISLEKIGIEDYFWFSAMYRISKNRGESYLHINWDQCIKILKYIKSYHEATKVFIDELCSFINWRNSWYKVVGDRIIHNVYNNTYIYKKDNNYNAWQVLAFWIEYVKIHFQECKKVDRLVNIKKDCYNGKSINKRFINNKIPVFMRSLVPIYDNWNIADELIILLLHRRTYIYL